MRRTLIGLLLIAACGGGIPGPPIPGVHELTPNYGTLEEVRLSDGTLCVVLWADNPNVTCDWQQGDR